MIPWECSECKNKNYYSKSVHRKGEVIIEMKIIGPKKVTVICRKCGEKQIIEVND